MVEVGSHRLSMLVGVIVIVASGACSRAERSAASLPGEELFRACVSCHGDDGRGNRAVGAPPIAGLPEWYVEAQVTKFRSGIRGAHPDDFEGLRMRPMARQMMNEAEVKSVSAYVASLPPVRSQATLTGGSASAGAASFGTCLACHGPRGQGNEALRAPPIAGQADWYLFAQLKKFKAGIRGADPKDAQGALMRPMAASLPSEQAMLDVVAHLTSLTQKETP